jgi:hypothetical protein
MKLFILLITLLFSKNIYSQSSDKIYQYRIGIKEVMTPGSSKLVEDYLYDIFLVKPEYNELLERFVFESYLNIDEQFLKKKLLNNEVVYFKKEELKINE